MMAVQDMLSVTIQILDIDMRRCASSKYIWIEKLKSLSNKSYQVVV